MKSWVARCIEKFLFWFCCCNQYRDGSQWLFFLIQQIFSRSKMWELWASISLYCIIAIRCIRAIRWLSMNNIYFKAQHYHQRQQKRQNTLYEHNIDWVSAEFHKYVKLFRRYKSLWNVGWLLLFILEAPHNSTELLTRNRDDDGRMHSQISNNEIKKLVKKWDTIFFSRMNECQQGQNKFSE